MMYVSSTGVLKETVGLLKAGASVRETCIHADKRIEEETGKAFKKDKNLQKGKTIDVLSFCSRHFHILTENMYCSILLDSSQIVTNNSLVVQYFFYLSNFMTIFGQIVTYVCMYVFIYILIFQS